LVIKIRTREAYGGAAAMLQPRTAGAEIAPYSQQLGDFFTSLLSVLVKPLVPKYSPPWGRADLSGKSRKSLPEFASGCTGGPAAASGGVWDFRGGLRQSVVRGRELMATALVDLYGGDDFEPFDRIILPEAYRPSDDEEFMCAKHRAYFLRKLKSWKEDIIEESRATMAQLQIDSLREPDLADRASSETDWGIELRTRDRQRKLIAKIDCAIRRLYEGEYGYCEVSGEPISLGRLEARPIATMTLEAQERHERIERISRDD
jgi:DnaK suppressor protein